MARPALEGFNDPHSLTGDTGGNCIMARRREEHIEHLLRRAGFGAVEEERGRLADMPYVAAVERLISYDRVPDDVDSRIGSPGTSG